ncbi:uncharacterized protein LOC116297713 [Actinia tenebrosa]|uniref:Uncharacterized protein LOC116297713 n=1 Tax=Actinia tenebrosa TaxID=6105 RepID=A0A6P8I2V9_ACTTE|nr:uncharacterized protein LOC116297713 [Actinia tenebrosa]
MSSNTRPIFEDRRGNIPIQMFGNPFLIMSSEVRHCLHGTTTKKDSRIGRTGKNHEHDYWRRMKVRSSVKRNCTATMHIRGIKVYKDYFVDPKFTSKNNFKHLKTKTLKNIRNALEESVNHPFTVERRFYLKIPLSSAHSGHQVGECLTPVVRKIDERVENKIYDLVRCNVKNVAEIQRCLIRFVKDDLFGGVAEGGKPKKGNKRYYPRRSDIRTHISKAIKGNLL